MFYLELLAAELAVPVNLFAYTCESTQEFKEQPGNWGISFYLWADRDFDYIIHSASKSEMTVS